jgi:hypothetical protein
MPETSSSLATYLTRQVERLASTVRQAADEIEVEGRQEAGGGQSMDALIVDSVVSRVREIAEECDELGRILSGYNSLVGENRPELEPSAPVPAVSVNDGGPRVSEGVRLLVTQMSVAGSGPAEIAQRLHDEFGVENSNALVEELFGQR